MDVYAIPDLTKKVRYGRRERQQEMEERGEREEMEVDIYDSADNPGPGTQQNTTQDQHAASDDSKKNNGFRAATVGLGLLCVILLAVITGLVINKNKDWNELHSRFTNLTKQKDLLQSRFTNLTEQKDLLQSRYNKLTEREICCESQHGFTFADGVCYYISTEWKTWEESRQYCRDKQSDLMTIKTKEKQDFVYRIVQWDQAGFWLGLTDRVEEGTFKWVDETPLTTTPTYWRAGEPNNYWYGYGYGDRDEDCVVFVKSGDMTRSWDDRRCSNTYCWICERVC